MDGVRFDPAYALGAVGHEMMLHSTSSGPM